MSTFLVEVRQIDRLEPHFNADLLEVAYLKDLDYPIVVRKGYEVGTKVIYFPLDAVLPAEVAEHLGLKSRKIKTMKLRGQISQGFAAPLETVAEGLDLPENTDMTWWFGVEKEEDDFVCSGRKHTLPSYLSVYDLENCERHKHVVEQLEQLEEVLIFEKMEGSNMSISFDGNFRVCSRRQEVFEGTMYEVGKKYETLVQTMFLHEPYTLRGEIVGPGIQGNIYKLKEHKFLLFDVQVGGRYLSYHEWPPIETCPLIYRGPLKDFGDLKASAVSQFGHTLREGIVVRSVEEKNLHRFGRAIIKQRSPEYLATH